MATKNKTIIPGVVLRKWKGGNKSIRFSCMINGNRFSKTCDMPVDLMVDPTTGRPTADLRAEYNVWVEQCSHKVGKVMRASHSDDRRADCHIQEDCNRQKFGSKLQATDGTLDRNGCKELQALRLCVGAFRRQTIY